MVAGVAAAMVWSGIAIYRTVPAGAHLADYVAAPAVTLFGLLTMTVCMYSYDAFVGRDVVRVRWIAAAELGVVALVAVFVLGRGAADNLHTDEQLMNGVILLVAAATAAVSWATSHAYATAINHVAGYLDGERR